MSEGHTSISSVKGTNNIEATLAWAECAISVWQNSAVDHPIESLSYTYTAKEKARIKELNTAVIPFGSSGLKHNNAGVEGRNYITANWLTAQEMMRQIRKNISVSTVISQYKPILQAQLDNVNAVLQGNT